MTHHERTAQLTTEGMTWLAEQQKNYRPVAEALVRQLAWARDKMERSERLCKDAWDRAHLRTVRMALVLDHPKLQLHKDLLMELNDTHVPTDAKTRKSVPLCTGVLDYFPDALLEVATVSRLGNDQHNPGQPLHWSKGKSMDESDALLRHLVDRGKRDIDGTRHSAKVAWRALALLQREIEAEQAPVPRPYVRPAEEEVA